LRINGTSDFGLTADFELMRNEDRGIKQLRGDPKFAVRTNPKSAVNPKSEVPLILNPHSAVSSSRTPQRKFVLTNRQQIL
jgi:hypothetical protein